MLLPLMVGKIQIALGGILLEFGAHKIHWSHAQIIFLAGFVSQDVLNKDPALWQHGDRPPPISQIMSLPNS
jgi:hypothetical protein